MKKNKYGHRVVRLIFVTAAMLMLLAVPVQAHASAKSTYKEAVSYYKKGKYAKARKTFKTLRENANEKCVKNMSSKRKSAFLKTVKKYVRKGKRSASSYVWDYFLTDIDKDGKAELIIQYGSTELNVKAYVYTYNRGAAQKIGSFYCGYATFYYDPRGNGVVMRQCHQFIETISTVKIKNGKPKAEQWADSRLAKSVSSYIDLPYALASHVSYDSNFKRSYDYSPLK